MRLFQNTLGIFHIQILQEILHGTVQLGMRARTRGRLLPGFYLNPPSSTIIAGATLSTPYSLPPNLYLDESGFLAELQSSNHE